MVWRDGMLRRMPVHVIKCALLGCGIVDERNESNRHAERASFLAIWLELLDSSGRGSLRATASCKLECVFFSCS